MHNSLTVYAYFQNSYKIVDCSLIVRQTNDLVFSLKLSVFEKRGSCQRTRIQRLKEDIEGSNKSSELSDTFIINIVKSHFETSTRNNDLEIPKILLKMKSHQVHL